MLASHAAASAFPAQDRFGFFRAVAVGGEYDAVATNAGLQGVEPSAAPALREARLERERCTKWLEYLTSPDSWAQLCASGRLKGACRKGVPDALRGSAWPRLSGADSLAARSPGLYVSLLRREPNPADLMCIAVDLPRTYPQHAFFHMADSAAPAETSTAGLLADAFLSYGQRSLRNVLWAYSVFDPEVGYCQGMAFVAGLLLVYMPEEPAFFMLQALMRSPRYALAGMYSPGLPRYAMVVYVYEALLARFLPRLSRHLRLLGVEHSMYASQWFITLFSYSFPFSVVTRAWDMFLVEGWKAIFRVALALMHLHERSLLAADFDEAMAILKRAGAGISADALVTRALRFRFTTALLTQLCTAYSSAHGAESASRVQEAKAEGRRKESMLAASLNASGTASFVDLARGAVSVVATTAVVPDDLVTNAASMPQLPARHEVVKLGVCGDAVTHESASLAMLSATERGHLALASSAALPAPPIYNSSSRITDAEQVSRDLTMLTLSKPRQTSLYGMIDGTEAPLRTSLGGFLAIESYSGGLPELPHLVDGADSISTISPVGDVARHDRCVDPPAEGGNRNATGIDSNSPIVTTVYHLRGADRPIDEIAVTGAAHCDEKDNAAGYGIKRALELYSSVLATHNPERARRELALRAFGTDAEPPAARILAAASSQRRLLNQGSGRLIDGLPTTTLADVSGVSLPTIRRSFYRRHPTRRQ